MKCYFTGKEIDETKGFPSSKDMSPTDQMRAEIAQRDHAEELSHWAQIQVVVHRDGANAVLLTEMVSPEAAKGLVEGSVKLSLTGGGK